MLRPKEIIGRITISQRQGSPKRTSPNLSHQRSKTSKIGITKNMQRNRKYSNPSKTVHQNLRINPITQVSKNCSESVRPYTGEKFVKIHKSLSPQSRLATNHFLLSPKTSNKKTLVLDIDETLSHTVKLPFGNYFLIRPGAINLIKDLCASSISAFSMLFIAEFTFASSIASGTYSMPMTCFALPATKFAIVPVPV